MSKHHVSASGHEHIFPCTTQDNSGPKVINKAVAETEVVKIIAFLVSGGQFTIFTELKYFV